MIRLCHLERTGSRLGSGGHHGIACRWPLAGSMVRYDKHRWPLCAAGFSLQELGHARWLSWAKRRGWFQGGARALPPLRLFRLPLGASNTDFPQAQGAYGHDRLLCRALAHAGKRLDVHGRAGCHSGYSLQRPLSLRDLYPGRASLYRASHRAGALGQGDQDHREQRVPPKSSGCSTRPSMLVARR